MFYTGQTDAQPFGAVADHFNRIAVLVLLASLAPVPAFAVDIDMHGRSAAAS